MNELFDHYTRIGIPIDELIYHYTSYETFVAHILRTQCLRFSPSTEKNDPHEFLIHDQESRISSSFSILYSEESLKKAKERISQIQNAIKEKRSEVRFASFCKSSKNTPGFLRMRMWTQYANCHKGVCLVFSKPRLVASVQSAIKPKDMKSSEPSNFDIDYKSLIDFEHFRPFDITKHIDVDPCVVARDYYTNKTSSPFAYKDNDYSDEDEFRILYMSTNVEYIPYNDSLLGVIFGIATSKEQHYYLRTIKASMSINLFTLRMDSNSFFEIEHLDI